MSRRTPPNDVSKDVTRNEYEPDNLGDVLRDFALKAIMEHHFFFQYYGGYAYSRVRMEIGLFQSYGESSLKISGALLRELMKKRGCGIQDILDILQDFLNKDKVGEERYFFTASRNCEFSFRTILCYNIGLFIDENFGININYSNNYKEFNSRITSIVGELTHYSTACRKRELSNEIKLKYPCSVLKEGMELVELPNMDDILAILDSKNVLEFLEKIAATEHISCAHERVLLYLFITGQVGDQEKECVKLLFRYTINPSARVIQRAKGEHKERLIDIYSKQKSCNALGFNLGTKLLFGFEKETKVSTESEFRYFIQASENNIVMLIDIVFKTAIGTLPGHAISVFKTGAGTVVFDSNYNQLLTFNRWETIEKQRHFQYGYRFASAHIIYGKTPSACTPDFTNVADILVIWHKKPGIADEISDDQQNNTLTF